MSDDIVVSPPAPPPAPPVTPPVAKWHDSWEPDLRGHAENRGYLNRPVEEVALEFAKAHLAAERKMGVPMDQILRLPKADAPAEEWSGVWNKLGVPADAAGYEFEKLTVGDKAVDPAAAATMAAFAKEANIPATAARQFAQSILKEAAKSNEGRSAVAQAALSEQKAELAKSWGARLEANKFIASQAAEKLGFSKEVIAALEGAAGYKATMEGLLKMGISMGEDRHVGPGPGGVYSTEGAQTKLNTLMQDKIWMEKFSKRDAAAVAEWDALTRLIAA